jgi:hypothetical protein
MDFFQRKYKMKGKKSFGQGRTGQESQFVLFNLK